MRDRSSHASIPVRASPSAAARGDDARAGHSRRASRPRYPRRKPSVDKENGKGMIGRRGGKRSLYAKPYAMPERVVPFVYCRRCYSGCASRRPGGHSCSEPSPLDKENVKCRTEKVLGTYYGKAPSLGYNISAWYGWCSTCVTVLDACYGGGWGTRATIEARTTFFPEVRQFGSLREPFWGSPPELFFNRIAGFETSSRPCIS